MMFDMKNLSRRQKIRLVSRVFYHHDRFACAAEAGFENLFT